MVELPALTPWPWPGVVGQYAGVLPEATVQTVAMFVRLDFHESCGEFVTSSWRPVDPEVASAMNWPGWPVAESDSALGMMVSAVTCSDEPFVTVTVETPVTTLLSGFDEIAVMTAVPWPTDVTSPSVCAVHG